MAPPNSCTPCACIPGRWDKDYFMQSVITLLCDLTDLGPVGSVTITSVVPGIGATNLGKAEDSAHASGDVGVFALAVRNDNAATSFTSANGDYSPFAADVNGRVFINPGVAATSLGKAEDAAHTSGDVGVQILGVRQDSLAGSTSADGDYGSLKQDSLGRTYTIPGTTQAAPVYGTLAFGAITGGYDQILSNGSNLVILDFYNGLNIDLEISIDGGTTIDYIPTLTGKVISLRDVGLHHAGSIWVKQVGASAPTSGLVKVTGWI